MAWVQLEYPIPNVSINYAFGGNKYGSWVDCNIPMPAGSFFCHARVTNTATIKGTLMNGYIEFASSGLVTRYSQVLGSAWSYDGGGGIAIPKISAWTGGDIAKARMVIDGTASTYTGSCSGSMIIWVEGEGTPSDPGEFDPRKFAIVSGGEAGKQITRIRYKLAQTLEDSGAWTGTVSGTKLYQLQ